MVILAAILITAAIGAAVFTSHKIELMQREVAQLESARKDAEQRLKEAKKQQETTAGSRDLLDKIRSETEEKIKDRKKEIEELEKMAAAEREVKSNDPRHQRRPDQGDPFE